MSLYQLRRDADGIVIVYNFAGHQVIKLEGGAAELIVMTYQNMSQYENRGDDYMAGVIAGCTHCSLLRPDVFNPLPEIPPIDPRKTPFFQKGRFRFMAKTAVSRAIAAEFDLPLEEVRKMARAPRGERDILRTEFKRLLAKPHDALRDDPVRT